MRDFWLTKPDDATAKINDRERMSDFTTPWLVFPLI